MSRRVSYRGRSPVEVLAQAMSEDELQEAVIDFAELHGWQLYHVARVKKRLRSHSSVGFPDLIMLRDSRQLVFELKAQGKHPTAKQRAWLAAFKAVGAETGVWRPLDWLSGRVDGVLAKEGR